MPKKLELLAYGPVGGWFGVSAQDFAAQLSAAPDAEEIMVRIHSEGGDALDGIAICNALRNHPGKVVCYVDGLAASAASMICMGADEIVMAENAVMMLHNPWTLAVGDGADLREQADTLDTLGRAYVAGYARKSGRPEDEIRALMDRYSWRTGVWMTAQDALSEKLADRVGPPVQAQARAGELRAAALAGAPAPLRQILAGMPAPPSAHAAQTTEKPMTIKDWAQRLRAAKTEQARAAVLAEMEKEEAKAEGEDDEEKDGEKAEGEDKEARAEGEDDEEKDGDDDEKHALRAAVAALQEEVRTLRGQKAAAALTPDQWVDRQVKAGYPAAKRGELLALRQRRPRAAELAAQAVLQALPQARRGARWTEGGAPVGTSPEASLPREVGRDEVRQSAETIVKNAQIALQNRTRSGLAQ